MPSVNSKMAKGPGKRHRESMEQTDEDPSEFQLEQLTQFILREYPVAYPDNTLGKSAARGLAGEKKTVKKVKEYMANKAGQKEDKAASSAAKLETGAVDNITFNQASKLATDIVDNLKEDDAATVLGALEKVKGASAYDSKVIAFFDKMIVKQMQFPNNRAIKKLLNKGSLKVLKKMISSKRNNAKDTLDVYADLQTAHLKAVTDVLPLPAVTDCLDLLAAEYFTVHSKTVDGKQVKSYEMKAANTPNVPSAPLKDTVAGWVVQRYDAEDKYAMVVCLEALEQGLAKRIADAAADAKASLISESLYNNAPQQQQKAKTLVLESPQPSAKICGEIFQGSGSVKSIPQSHVLKWSQWCTIFADLKSINDRVIKAGPELLLVAKDKHKRGWAHLDAPAMTGSITRTVGSVPAMNCYVALWRADDENFIHNCREKSLVRVKTGAPQCTGDFGNEVDTFLADNCIRNDANSAAWLAYVALCKRVMTEGITNYTLTALTNARDAMQARWPMAAITMETCQLYYDAELDRIEAIIKDGIGKVNYDYTMCEALIEDVDKHAVLCGHDKVRLARLDGLSQKVVDAKMIEPPAAVAPPVLMDGAGAGAAAPAAVGAKGAGKAAGKGAAGPPGGP